MKPAVINHKSTRPYEPGKVAVHSAKDPVTFPGRRHWAIYRDLGAKTATNGALLAQITTKPEGTGPTPSTGWHYHICEHQFVYITKGWIELEFEDGRTIRIHEGDSIYIPGHYKHNEIQASDAYEVLELSIPADLGTKACEMPETFRAANQ